MSLGAVAYALAAHITGQMGSVSAQAPDGTAAGGNARGANAVDWQTGRATATQVASNAGSVIGGGANNTSSGQQSVVAGGLSNAAQATNSAIGGGNGNSIGSAGVRAFIGGGQSNSANALRAVVSGGNTNAASSEHGWIPGGSSATTRTATGRGAWASGNFASQGDAQAGEHVLRCITTDATQTRLTADGNEAGATNVVNLPTHSVYLVRCMVVALQTGGSAGTVGDHASWEVTATLRRSTTGATGSITGGSATAAVPLHSSGTASAWRLAVDADNTAKGLAISGTGEANKTIRWVARVLSVEVMA